MVNEELNKKLAEQAGYKGTPEDTVYLEAKAEEERNRKLVEWVGWHWEKYQITTDGMYMYGTVLLAPDEEIIENHIGYIPAHTPNFTQSLDACFKWFKPKFRSMACGSLSEDSWRGAWAKVITHSGETSWVRELGIEPAVAVCKAIEKLIDKEVNHK